jgi:hypothetical protein
VHAADHSAKHNVLIIKESERGASRDIELGVAWVFQTAALAHAQESDFCVLDVEWFICKFTTVDRFSIQNTATLNVHTWHNAVNFGVLVTDFGSITLLCNSITETNEVLASLGGDILEKFKDNNAAHSWMRYVHLSVAASVRWVNGLSVLILCHLRVDVETVLLQVVELVESPLSELISVTDVFAPVKKNEGFWFIVRIENSFLLVCGLLKELGPLGLKELKALSVNLVRVIPFKGLGDSDSLVELGVIDHTCYGNFSSHFCFNVYK